MVTAKQRRALPCETMLTFSKSCGGFHMLNMPAQGTIDKGCHIYVAKIGKSKPTLGMILTCITRALYTLIQNAVWALFSI
jgi:hypothetical protein